MTLADIRSSTCTYLTAADIAPVLGCDPHSIRTQAKKGREGRDALGFPVVILGNRVLIPRLPFLMYMEGDIYGRS